MDAPTRLHPRGPRWPGELDQVTPQPDALWVRGRLELLDVRPRVAVVGSRSPTPYGVGQAERFGRELARAGACVVSGLARGVDAAAHTAALDVGGASLAVLGCGVDAPWPGGPLAERMLAEGLLLSEFSPGTGPRKHHFPLRNRLISCLSSGVLVVEAAARSGSLITARWALDQGRPVYAVPGRVDHPLAAGVLQLLRDGATPVGSPGELLEDLFGLAPPRAMLSEAMPSEPEPPEQASSEQGSCGETNALLAALVGETLTADELAARLALPIGRALAQLLELELAGRVVRGPGGLYRRPTAGPGAHPAGPG